jgi:hypothetical protein
MAQRIQTTEARASPVSVWQRSAPVARSTRTRLQSDAAAPHSAPRTGFAVRSPDSVTHPPRQSAVCHGAMPIPPTLVLMQAPAAMSEWVGIAMGVTDPQPNPQTVVSTVGTSDTLRKKRSGNPKEPAQRYQQTARELSPGAPCLSRCLRLIPVTGPTRTRGASGPARGRLR